MKTFKTAEEVRTRANELSEVESAIWDAKKIENELKIDKENLEACLEKVKADCDQIKSDADKYESDLLRDVKFMNIKSLEDYKGHILYGIRIPNYYYNYFSIPALLVLGTFFTYEGALRAYHRPWESINLVFIIGIIALIIGFVTLYNNIKKKIKVDHIDDDYLDAVHEAARNDYNNIYEGNASSYINKRRKAVNEKYSDEYGSLKLKVEESEKKLANAHEKQKTLEEKYEWSTNTYDWIDLLGIADIMEDEGCTFGQAYHTRMLRKEQLAAARAEQYYYDSQINAQRRMAEAAERQAYAYEKAQKTMAEESRKQTHMMEKQARDKEIARNKYKSAMGKVNYGTDYQKKWAEQEAAEAFADLL